MYISVYVYMISLHSAHLTLEIKHRCHSMCSIKNEFNAHMVVVGIHKCEVAKGILHK